MKDLLEADAAFPGADLWVIAVATCTTPPRKNRPAHLRRPSRDEVVSAINAGGSMRSVAAQLGTSYGTINNIIREAERDGVAIRELHRGRPRR